MNSFPQFPEFRKVTFKDRAAYEAFYKEFDPYSDFSFNDLMIWLNYNDDLAISSDEGNLVFRFSNPFEGNAVAYTLLGRGGCESTIRKIFALQREQGLEPGLSMVPEVVIDNIALKSLKNFDFYEDRDNRDYIFRVPDVYRANGQKFADFRHKINYFLKKYSDELVFREMDLRDPAERNIVRAALATWSTNDLGKRQTLENAALDTYLQHAEELSPSCIGLFIKGKLASFSIFHLPPQKGYAIGNHMKYNPEYRYIFDFTYFCTINWMHAHGIEYVNGEQDLGIPGLRIHKQEMQPCRFLRRYVIRPLLQSNPSEARSDIKLIAATLQPAA